MVDTFFTLDGSVALQKSNGLNSRQITIEKNSSRWRDSFELHSGQETYFTGPVIKSTCEIWLIMQHFHCADHPQASGLIERSNSTIKTQLPKLSEAFYLLWPKVLPLTLFNLSSTCFGQHCVLLK